MIAGILVGLVAGAGGGLLALTQLWTPAPPVDGATVSCHVTDGDTLRCGDERVRLLGIDAPELGKCRPGRTCAPGDPVASTAHLAEAAAGPLTIERVGTDRYGRTLGLVSGADGDLSCWQLRSRSAIYVSEWDDGYRVLARCADAVALSKVAGGA